ncbi:MAG: GntR family transcriptional regulator [Sedimentisphaerales bacterium]|nr:GntR family transcriptional regulator [Sedimentisphaerales bacterium]
MNQLDVKLERGRQGDPLYEQIRRQISHSIETKRLQPGERLPTVAALVRKWDVDFGTVKSAFDLLEAEGLLKVESRKGALIQAKPLKKYTLAYIRCGSDTFAVDISEGAASYCKENNQNWSCIGVDADLDRYLETVRHPPQDIEGMLIIPLEGVEFREAVNQAISSGIKVVFIDRVLQDIATSSVVADNFAGGYRATHHLIDRHGEPVFYVGLTENVSSARDRVNGWAAAMREHLYNDIEPYLWPMAFSDTDMVTSPDFLKHPTELANKLFDSFRGEKCSILASDDYIAQAFHTVASERGFEVGKNVFIVGFNDLSFCKEGRLELSSVYLPRWELGFEGAKLLHAELLGEIKNHTNRILPVELHIRQSSLGR